MKTEFEGKCPHTCCQHFDFDDKENNRCFKENPRINYSTRYTPCADYEEDSIMLEELLK